MKHIAAAALVGAVVMAGHSSAYIITFDNLTGPSSTPPGVAAPVTEATPIGNVLFSNGAILTNTTNLPADHTSVFYNSSFLTGTGGSAMTITLPQTVNNFFFDLYNGWTSPDTFTVSDSGGHSQTFANIPSNFSSGHVQVIFVAGTFGNVVTINTGNPNYDYVVDNVGFNQAGPGPVVPEPAAWALMLVGFAGIGASLRRRKPAAA